MKTSIPYELHWEDTDLVVMSRVKGSDGSFVTPADLLSLTCFVYDRDSKALIGSNLLNVGEVVYGTLQTTSPWTVDSVGYNFRYTVPGSLFPNGNKTYRVEVIGTPVSGSTYPLAILNVNTRDRLSG